MKHHIAFIKELVAKGGPESSEYHELSQWLNDVRKEIVSGTITKDDLKVLRDSFGEALSILTVQGFAFTKPHGYPGDYEIIEKIYQEYISKNPDLRKWDLFFQLQKAPIAVRNRKHYFQELLKNLEGLDKREGPIGILNIASGPARDLFEFLSGKNDGRIFFDNVEFDPLAISYAKNLCKDHMDHINFLHTNAFDFSTENKYRLIWSAGLFDYLGDKKFIYLINHVLPLLEDGGELVVGNFSQSNPSQAYMEIMGDWNLKHRTPEQLIAFGKACNFDESDIRVGKEPEGVNLFLHLKRGKEFIPPPEGSEVL